MNFFTPEEHHSLDSFIALDAQLDDDNIPLRNEVARIALSVIQSRLPQFAVISAGGTVTLGREYFDTAARDVMLLPQFLFMINWADTAPGISWPESYHATYIPGFNRWIVTAAQDSPDMWGVTELAIGSFESGIPLHDGCRCAITDWWRFQSDGGDQDKWAYVWQEGAICQEQADEWAESVWRTEIDTTEED
jgi:hypothetical protein